jgi:hypothetical protein
MKLAWQPEIGGGLRAVVANGFTYQVWQCWPHKGSPEIRFGACVIRCGPRGGNKHRDNLGNVGTKEQAMVLCERDHDRLRPVLV